MYLTLLTAHCPVLSSHCSLHTPHSSLLTSHFKLHSTAQHSTTSTTPPRRLPARPHPSRLVARWLFAVCWLFMYLLICSLYVLSVYLFMSCSCMFMLLFMYLLMYTDMLPTDMLPHLHLQLHFHSHSLFHSLTHSRIKGGRRDYNVKVDEKKEGREGSCVER